MAIPSGYTALDFVGFTDKGTYANNVTYVINDLVHYGGDIWKCKIDNTIGITPAVGANWEQWLGASANLVERIIAPLEQNPATVAYTVGRQIIYDDWLWEVIAPIAIGDTLVDYAVDPSNANIKKAPAVETQLLALSSKAYQTDDSTETTIADDDLLPFYDTSATARKKSTWSNIIAKIKAKLGTAAAKDVPASGNASTTQVVMGNDTRLTDARNAADVSAWAKAANKPSYTASEISYGTSSNVGSEIQTLTQALSIKADESDLSSISITGSTNNTGSTISKGTFFYLNGILVKSKVDIANGATLTEDTNYETLSKGVLNDLTNKYSGIETSIGIYVNKILYRKVIDIGQLPSSAGIKNINHHITGNFTIRHVYGYASTGTVQVPLPHPNDVASTIAVYVTASNVNIEVFSDRSAYIEGQVILEYTKD